MQTACKSLTAILETVRSEKKTGKWFKDGTDLFMKDIEIIKENFFDYIPKNKKEYQKFIQFILNHADSVCVTIKPFLDNIAEFNRSIWAEMKYSVLDYGFARAASNFKNDKSHLILLKKDYSVIHFFKERKGIFDFSEEDTNLGISLEDPAFIKDDKVFCYTVTHEKICIVSENIYRQL